MGWLRTLVGVSTPAAAAPATPPAQPRDAAWQQQAAHQGQPAGSDAELGAKQLTPNSTADAAPPVLAGKAAASPPMPAPDAAGPDEEGEGEEGSEAWYYGADVLRRGWRHTEMQLLLWVLACLVAAVAINIGVAGGLRCWPGPGRPGTLDARWLTAWPGRPACSQQHH